MRSLTRRDDDGDDDDKAESIRKETSGSSRVRVRRRLQAHMYKNDWRVSVRPVVFVVREHGHAIQ